MSQGETIIPLNRGKIVVLILGSLVFLAISIWIWTIPAGEGPLTPLLRKIVAIAGSGFSVICAICGLFKLLDTKPGLVIDHEGIVDNSSGVAAGRVLWSEITGFQESEIYGQRFLTIQVTDPERILNRSGYLKAKINSANLKLTGSPINISSNTLSIGFDELMDTLAQALDSYCKTEQDGGEPFYE